MLGWCLNLCYGALLALAMPWLVYRALAQGKTSGGWRERLFGLSAPRAGQGPCLWLHAVSVGEVVQLGPIIERLGRQRPDLEVVVSVTTATGRDVAQQRYPGCRVIHYPLDFTWTVRRAMARIRPTAIGLVELELWPNFLLAAERSGIPVALINGRISEQSHRGYRVIRPLMRRLLPIFQVCLVQNEEYARRLKGLGAAADQVVVSGSIKFDGVSSDRDNPRTRELRRAFALAADDPVFIAGSTQSPEEAYAVEAWLAARKRRPKLRLIIVPRHKERFDEVGRLIRDEFGLPLLRRSRLEVESPPSPRAEIPPVLLLDTLGELSACWGLANVAFVGGSLTRRGGQNMIEPAGYGAAVLIGPNTWNFRDVVDLLLSRQAAVVVRDATELTCWLLRLLDEPETRQRLGSAAQGLVLAQRGAADRTVERLLALLPPADTGRPNAARSAA